MGENANNLNAHAPPPSEIKDIFKKYQKLKVEEIDLDPSILDFSRAELPDGCVPTRTINGLKLASTIQDFLGAGSSVQSPIEAAPIYSDTRLPGLLVVPALLPSNVQEELLSRLFHRDLSVPKHQTNLHLHYDVPYPILDTDLSDNAERRPSFFSYPPSSDVQFIPKDPSVHKPLSISKVMQKSLRWMTLGGQYDWTKKEYPAEAPPPFPKDVANLLEGLFPDMVAEAAIVNLYSPGDTLSLHRDVSEQCARGLVSISIGCDCVFVIGVKDASDTVVVRLRSGDAVFMSGDARFAWHGVPKIMSATCPPDISDWPAGAGGGQYEDWKGWMRNKRINLNVRQMFD